MLLFDEIIIKDSIEIETNVKNLWNFFDNLDKNYLLWHPQDHVKCKWIKGRPHQVGSIAYFEELLDDKLFKIKVKTIRVEKYKYSEVKPLFPLSIFHPKGIYYFEDKGSKCIFTAVNIFHVPKLFKKSFYKSAKIDALKKHIKEEGTLLKNILEKNK